MHTRVRWSVWRRSILNGRYRMKSIKFMCCLPPFEFHGISMRLINKYAMKTRRRHTCESRRLRQSMHCRVFVGVIRRHTNSHHLHTPPSCAPIMRLASSCCVVCFALLFSLIMMLFSSCQQMTPNVLHTNDSANGDTQTS